MSAKASDPGWNIEDAMRRLRAGMDPYIWEQGQELYRRGAVEDFQMSADGTIHVVVLDPRDARKFFVKVSRDREGTVRARCECPYRLRGVCRHQVVSLEYLSSISEQTEAEASDRASGSSVEEPGTSVEAGPPPEGPVLYRLPAGGASVSTTSDGSLLRVVLHSLGSLGQPHRIGLQLYTGTGWTEVRTADLERWIARGRSGAHPRDALLVPSLVHEGVLSREVDSEQLARLLGILRGSRALVDRGGEPLEISPWPWRLAARLERGPDEGLALRFLCHGPGGETLDFAEVSLLPAVSPWIQLEAGTFHPLIAGVTGEVLADLQGEDWSEISGEDLDRFLTRGLENLERICPGSVEEEDGLTEEVEGVSGARVRLEGTTERLAGELELRYGEQWVAAPETPEPWTSLDGGTVIRYPPAGRSLERAHRELESIGFRQEEGLWVLEGAGALPRLLEPRPAPFVELELPEELETLDLVRRVPALHLDVRPRDPEESGDGGPPGEGFSTDTRGSGIAWLELSATLRDGDREVPLELPRILEALEEGSGGVVELEDGSVLGLDHESVRALPELCGGARATAGVLKLPLSRLTDLLEERQDLRVRFHRGIRELAEALRTGGIPGEAALREDIASTLRTYQKEALKWFGLLSRWGLTGILADEMGLGKTLMALAHFFGRESRDATGDGSPVLVVCPSSLVFNWLEESRRFFPEVQAEGLQGLTPAEREERIRMRTDLLVTSYALLRRDREALESREFRAVVLDEAQHIKNPESQTARAAFALQASERWSLTGTPIENHLGELWSLFHFLMPGFLGTRAEFEKRHVSRTARGEAPRRLRDRVRPFILRRTKQQVLRELPPRIEQTERVPMTEAQRRVYETFLLRARGELDGVTSEKGRFQILAALTRLRQVCCHPALVLEPEEARGEDLAGGKFDLLRELLGECVEEGHRVLLYSQFTSMLDLMEGLLEEMEIPRCRLDGSTRNREAVVRRFTGDDSIPVFLISLKAGGLGLNLTEADTVILYDPWWNPAVEAQAAARAHRIGQTVPVHVHKLITQGSVEEKILDLQATKRDLARAVVEADSEEDALAALTVDELRGVLFED